MKKNLRVKTKESTKVGVFLKIPAQLKEDAQVYCIKNKMTLTDLVQKTLNREIYE